MRKYRLRDRIIGYNHIQEVKSVPRTKAYMRSVKTDAERRAKNGPVKAAVRNAARKVIATTQTGSKEDAQATLAVASGLLDKAARKGVIHKNAAARKKSELAKKVNAMA